VEDNAGVSGAERAVAMDFIRNMLPSNFDRYPRGIDFPIGKQELLRRLKENVAPGVVVDQVGKRLPEGQYRSAQDFLKRLGN
jgi:Protein of unknown function (DUF2795)